MTNKKKTVDPLDAMLNSIHFKDPALQAIVDDIKHPANVPTVVRTNPKLINKEYGWHRPSVQRRREPEHMYDAPLLNPSAQKTSDLQGKLTNANKRIKALGGTPVGQKKKNVSIWGHISDILMRPVNATSESYHAGHQAEKTMGTGGQLKAMGHGFMQGITGKKETSWADVANKDWHLGQHTANVVGNVINSFAAANPGAGKHEIIGEKGKREIANTVNAGTGGVLDIGLDPTTYAGMGLVPKIAKLKGMSAAAAEHLTTAEKILARNKLPVKQLSEHERELLTGKRYIQGLAKHSEEAHIHAPLQEIRAGIVNTRQGEIKAALAGTEQWAKKLGTGKSAAVMKDLNKTAYDAAKQEGDQWLNAAVKHYQDIVNTRIQHGIGIGLAGSKAPKLAIVGTPTILSTVGKIKDIDVVNRGLSTFQKAFKASAGISPGLHNIRLTATNMGFTRAEYLGNRLRGVARQLPKEDRVTAWDNALNGSTHSGHEIEADGLKQDLSHFYTTEIERLQHNVLGTSTGDTPFSLRELNAMMPPSFKGKWINTKGHVDVRKSMKAWELKDGPAALWVAQQAFERAAANRSMYTAAGDAMGMRTKGHGIIQGSEKIVRGMKSRGWREIDKKIHHGTLDGVLFDPETAKGLERIHQITNSEREWNGFIKAIAKPTSYIKFGLTVPNPGFHVRNSIGDVFVNEMDRVQRASYKHAAILFHNQAEKFGGESPLIMSAGDLLEAAEKRKSDVLFHTKYPLTKPNGQKTAAVTQAELFAGLIKHGISQNYSLAEFGSLAANPGTAGMLGSAAKAWLVNKSELRENFFRAAHFIDLVKRNPYGARSLDEVMAKAAERVRKMHFDYSDFTKFEKQWMSNIIPFYKWTRKALPLMLELLMTNPGKVIIPTKAQYALSRAMGQDPTNEDPFPDMNGLIPSWIQEMGYSPAGKVGGKNMMFGVPSPFTDMFTQTIGPGANAVKNAPKTRGMSLIDFVGQQSNPLIKSPTEMITNHNFFLSSPGHGVPIRSGDSGGKDDLSYLLNQLPYARQIGRATADSDKANIGSSISQMSGIYAQQISPSMQRGELSRENFLAAKRYADLKKKVSKQLEESGYPVPKTPTEWEKFLERSTGGAYQRPKRKKASAN